MFSNTCFEHFCNTSQIFLNTLATFFWNGTEDFQNLWEQFLHFINNFSNTCLNCFKINVKHFQIHVEQLAHCSKHSFKPHKNYFKSYKN